jgi:hypothetical protein
MSSSLVASSSSQQSHVYFGPYPPFTFFNVKQYIRARTHLNLYIYIYILLASEYELAIGNEFSIMFSKTSFFSLIASFFLAQNFWGIFHWQKYQKGS